MIDNKKNINYIDIITSNLDIIDINTLTNTINISKSILIYTGSLDVSFFNFTNQILDTVYIND